MSAVAHPYRGAVPADRAWNTWDSVYPGDMLHLPSGVRASFCAYSAARNAFTRFPPGAAVRLGPRAIDGAFARLDLEHGGTTLALDWTRPDPAAVVAAWQGGRSGEWGLRFWVMLVLQVEGRDDVTWHHDEATGLVTADLGPPATDAPPGAARHVAVQGSRRPLMVTHHASLDALAAEYHAKGYFFLDSRDAAGPVCAVRYNLEEMPSARTAVAVGQSPDAARTAAQAALGAAPSALRDLGFAGSSGRTGDQEGRGGRAGPFVPRSAPPGARLEGRTEARSEDPADPLAAIRDVIGWNTVWDPVNRRPYTSLSRNWVAQKFGGFGVWLNDIFYHALLAGVLDAPTARANVEAVLAGATPWGNLPCLLTGNDAWVDRSQPPICSFLVWTLYLRLGDRALLDRAWPVLLANHEWWWRCRDGNGNGILEYGTSPVGRGLYRGTKLAAKDESMMDNAPIHDEAVLVESACTLDCEDVALNSLVALDGEMLGLMAEALGDAAAAHRLRGRAEALKHRIATELWDEERGIFANRLWSGRFVRSLAPTSFFPLIAGAATREQAARMVEGHLLNPAKFWGEWALPAVTRDDPAFHDNVYWRGRVWPPLNAVVYHGLRRYRLDDAAAELADASLRIFMRNWVPDRACGENFSSTTGQVHDQPDTDGFYAWGALMPYLAVAEIAHVDPWDGLTVSHPGRDVDLGPIRAPGGEIRVAVTGPVMRVDAGAAAFTATFASAAGGRVRGIAAGSDGFAATFPPCRVAFEGRVAGATLDGASVALASEGGRVVVDVPAPGGRLEVRRAR